MNRLSLAAYLAVAMWASTLTTARAEDPVAPVPNAAAATEAPVEKTPMLPANSAASGDAKAAVAKPVTEKPKTTAAKSKAANATGDEKLPWAAEAAPSTGGPILKDKAAGDASQGPLKMACPGLYEAACREAQGCTWIADIKLGSGADVKAHCTDRKPTAAKDAPAKKAPAKTTAAAVKPKPPAGDAAKASTAPSATPPSGTVPAAAP